MSREEHKPLSFSTTMRNPERIASFLSCLETFDGMVLTSDLIMRVVRKVIKKKLYKPMIIGRTSNLNNIYLDEETTFNDEQINFIIENSPQDHKEKGFDYGWDSRFDTWYKIAKEFGFVYYNMNEPITLSQTGHMLINAYENTDDEFNSGAVIQNVFLNALIKYQTDNPFRRNLNKNKPVILLLKVLKMLKDDSEENGAGVFIKELPFLTCWPNFDTEELYEYIKNFREVHHFSASDEIVYEHALQLLESNNRVRFKMKQILKEGVDDLIRKLRITGIFSLRGYGRFIDINELELEKIDYVLENYSEYIEFSDEQSYFNYMGQIDPRIIAIETSSDFDLDSIRQEALRRFANHYSSEEVHSELLKLQNNRASQDDYLKHIENPTRLEFLTSIALVQAYPNSDVRPNYNIDDEGNPTMTARGGMGDILVYDPQENAIVEVTLMRSREQAIVEIPAITRHLEDLQMEKEGELCFSLFIAPLIHRDTTYMCEFTKHSRNLDIVTKTISEFIEQISSTEKISDFL